MPSFLCVRLPCTVSTAIVHNSRYVLRVCLGPWKSVQIYRTPSSRETCSYIGIGLAIGARCEVLAMLDDRSSRRGLHGDCDSKLGIFTPRPHLTDRSPRVREGDVQEGCTLGQRKLGFSVCPAVGSARGTCRSATRCSAPKRHPVDAPTLSIHCAKSTAPEGFNAGTQLVWSADYFVASFVTA